MNSNTNWSQMQANHILLQEWGEDDERQEKEHRHVPEIDSDLEDATENKNQDEIAVRTGVVLADLVLTATTADKKLKLDRLDRRAFGLRAKRVGRADRATRLAHGRIGRDKVVALFAPLLAARGTQVAGARTGGGPGPSEAREAALLPTSRSVLACLAALAMRGPLEVLCLSPLTRLTLDAVGGL